MKLSSFMTFLFLMSAYAGNDKTERKPASGEFRCATTIMGFTDDARKKVAELMVSLNCDVTKPFSNSLVQINQFLTCCSAR